MTKNERNETIIRMHNAGETVRAISDVVGVGKSTVNNVITAHIDSVKPNDDTVVGKPVEVSTDKLGERIDSFVGWNRIVVNQYAHKDTGEIINVKFIKAQDINSYGHFVRAA